MKYNRHSDYKTYFAMRINLCLNLFLDNKFSDFLFYLFNAQVKSVRNFPHIDDFVWSHILNECLLSDAVYHVSYFVAEKLVKYESVIHVL